jgi:hypothetical protein
VAFVEDDQADIVDQEGSLLSAKSSFSGVAMMISRVRRASSSPAEGRWRRKARDTKSEWREGLPEGSLGLRRQGAQRRDDQHPACGRQGHERGDLGHSRFAGAGRQGDDQIVGDVRGTLGRFALRWP